MSRTQAIVALTALIVVFTIGMLEYLIYPSCAVIPEVITKVVSAIFIGVAITVIVTGLRHNGKDQEG